MDDEGFISIIDYFRRNQPPHKVIVTETSATFYVNKKEVTVCRRRQTGILHSSNSSNSSIIRMARYILERYNDYVEEICQLANMLYGEKSITKWILDAPGDITHSIRRRLKPEVAAKMDSLNL